MRDRRRRDGRLAADVSAGMSAAVAELNRGLRTGAMNFIHETRKPGQKTVVVDTDLAAAMAAGLLGRGHLDGDEADPTPCSRPIIGDRVLGDVPLLIRRARGHRRHDDTIGDVERTDARRGEQDVHAMLVTQAGAEPPLASPDGVEAALPFVETARTWSVYRKQLVHDFLASNQFL